MPVGGSRSRFVVLEDLIVANINSLFPGTKAGECHTFRVTRDADIELREEEADDLLRVFQRELRKRRFGTPVRLEVSPSMPRGMIDYLAKELGLDQEDVYVIDGPLNPQDLATLYDLDRPELKDEPFEPEVPRCIGKAKSIFDAIKERDILLHHPFDSYTCVTVLLRRRSTMMTLAIKICLYRTGRTHRFRRL